MTAPSGEEQRAPHGRYVPERGDLVWLSFTPQAGHEQAGRRPAMCLTPSSYNSRTGLGWFCPLTRQVKGYPFEVILQLSEASDDSSHLSGVILADHLTSADWRARQARYAAKVSAGCLQQVVEHILRLLPAVTSAETDQEAGQSLSGRTAEHNNEDA